jgi:hypothetical protein
MKEIKLTKNQVAIVDDDQFDTVSQFKWYCGKDGYAKRSQNKKIVFMHRVIMSPDNNKLVDHINGDTLDNRKTNLRYCNNQQNNYNRGPMSHNISGYKGVSWRKSNQKWYAQIKHNAKTKYIGYFKTKEEAAIAYNNVASKLFGEFARLNKI